MMEVEDIWSGCRVEVILLNQQLATPDENDTENQQYTVVITFASDNPDFKTDSEPIANLMDKVSAFGRSLNGGSGMSIHLVGKEHLFSCVKVDHSHLLAVWVEKEDEERVEGSQEDNEDKNYSRQLGYKYEQLQQIAQNLASILAKGGN